MNTTPAQVEREALTLPAEDQTQLVDKLWDSLEGRGGREEEQSSNLLLKAAYEKPKM